ncbi:MAG: carboxy-S-adenosyl-L-methionine synthase CmoA [Pseudomonadales bacterium]
MSRDDVFRTAQPQLVDFAFDERVAAVFPDMIRRSVPGYELVVPMSGLLAARQLTGSPTPLVYDLGCSLGATAIATLRAADALGIEAIRIRAVDDSRDMLDRAQTLIDDHRVEFIEADVRQLPLEPCAAVLMNFVLQFIPPEDRTGLLRKIHDSLAPEGALILAEKVRSDDPEEQAFNDAAHLDFKRANGYSELEISRKRSALERVMIVDTPAAHMKRFAAAGFTRCRQWYTCLNWAAFIVQP